MERDRELVRLYYGLQDGSPRRQAELAERYGVSPARRVGELIRLAVAQLLGPGTVPAAIDTCVICGASIVRRGHRARATCGKASDGERRRRQAVERHARGPWSRAKAHPTGQCRAYLWHAVNDVDAAEPANERAGRNCSGFPQMGVKWVSTRRNGRS